MVVALALLFLGVIFFGIPAILLFNAAAKFVAHGWALKSQNLCGWAYFFWRDSAA